MLSGPLQVVASACRFLYPGGDGVSGDGGAARIGPTKSKNKHDFSQHDVAPDLLNARRC